MTGSVDVAALEAQCRLLFNELASLQAHIRTILTGYADGKILKGDELVGWLGEIYGKLRLDGTLVHDKEEHDIICTDGRRVSVKTRKGFRSGWRRTSAIPKFNGKTCPSHLLFVHLRDDYSIDRMWLFAWSDLVSTDRFKRHIVRGEHRSYIFTLNEVKDNANVIYSGQQNLYPSMRDTSSATRATEPTKQEPCKCDEFKKLHRIERWAHHPAQVNHKIIRAFLDLEENGKVRLTKLREYCEQEHSIVKFKSNYVNMKTDEGHSHGKVFFDDGVVVKMWPRVRREVDQHFQGRA